VTFAVCDDVAQGFGGSGRGFFGEQRRPAKVAALGSFPVTLRTVFLIDRVRGQARVSGWSLGMGYGEEEEQGTDGDGEVIGSQAGPY